MATADRMQTTGGSWVLLGCIVPKDAHIVHLLRQAGTIILGKTNLDEWAGMRGSIYSLGYSARGGQCRNPYLLNRSASKLSPYHLGVPSSSNDPQMVAVQAVQCPSRQILYPSPSERKQTVASSAQAWLTVLLLSSQPSASLHVAE